MVFACSLHVAIRDVARSCAVKNESLAALPLPCASFQRDCNPTMCRSYEKRTRCVTLHCSVRSWLPYTLQCWYIPSSFSACTQKKSSTRTWPTTEPKSIHGFCWLGNDVTYGLSRCPLCLVVFLCQRIRSCGALIRDEPQFFGCRCRRCLCLWLLVSPLLLRTWLRGVFHIN